MTRRERLLEAAALLETVYHSLNTNTAICDCCGFNVRENWDQWQKGSEIATLRKKIVRIALSRTFQD